MEGTNFIAAIDQRNDRAKSHSEPEIPVFTVGFLLAECERAVRVLPATLPVTYSLSLDQTRSATVPSSADFDVKDRVKQATDVVDLIGSVISLRRQGSGYVGLCPWHEDTRPSFQVNPARQSWACWVCDLRGDVFNFMMKYEGVEFREALRLLAERAGIPLTSHYKKVAKGSKDDKDTLYKAMAWAEEAYHQCLLHSDAAIPIREYLEERGITQESIETFRIGFAPLSWSWLVDQASKTSFQA